MKNKLILIACGLFLTNSLHAARLYKEEVKRGGYTSQNGYFVSHHDLPKMSAQQHYDLAAEAFKKQDWMTASKNFRIVKLNFYNDPLAYEAIFFLAVSYFNMNELDAANSEFSDYLKNYLTPKHFQEAIEYKFVIAERFKNGERKRMFGVQSLPKWSSGKYAAVEIYDEVIAAIPAHEYAVQALYAKGLLLNEMKEFRESVDTLQLLIKRFPKHQLAPESFLAITKTYVDQCRYEYQNPDLITFAEINLKRFTQEFPRDPRIEDVKNDVHQIKEEYAKGLYQTGLFYERKEKFHASVLYYKNALELFPETSVAVDCETRIAHCQKRMDKLHALAHNERPPMATP